MLIKLSIPSWAAPTPRVYRFIIFASGLLLPSNSKSLSVRSVLCIVGLRFSSECPGICNDLRCDLGSIHGAELENCVARSMVSESSIVRAERRGESHHRWETQSSFDPLQVSILLAKAEFSRASDEVWPSLLDGEFRADPLVLHEMRKKIDLEKFQIENPGFDFSGAELSKKYDSLPGEEGAP